MKKNKTKIFSKLLLAGSALTASITSAYADKYDFSNIFVFGDSFTTQDTWTSLLMNDYGVTRVSNKNDFSIGGDISENLPARLLSYKNSGTAFDSKSLAVVFTVASDYADISVYVLLDYLRLGYSVVNIEAEIQRIKTALENKTDSIENIFPRSVALIHTKTSAIKNFVNDIHDLGARYILVGNYFNDSLRRDLSQVDDIPTSDYIGFILPSKTNEILYSKLNELPSDRNIILVDFNRLYNEVTANPAKYFTADDIANSYRNMGLFFDLSHPSRYHPTEEGHKVHNQYVRSILESPARVALLREIALGHGKHRINRVSGISADFATGKQVEGTEFGADIDYLSTKASFSKRRNIKISSSNQVDGSVSVNFKYRDLDNLLLGLVVQSGSADTKFGNGNGKGKIRDVGATVHATYAFSQPFFVRASVGADHLSYDVKRRIPLGISSNSEKGKTQGTRTMLSLGTGYVWKYMDNVTVVPYADLNHQKITMKSFREKGDVRSTTMSFNVPDRKSTELVIGTKVETKVDVQGYELIPSFGIAYNHEFSNTYKKDVYAKVSDMLRWFHVPSYAISKSSFDINAGLSTQIKNVGLGFNVGTNQNKKIRQYSVGISLKAGF